VGKQAIQPIRKLQRRTAEDDLLVPGQLKSVNIVQVKNKISRAGAFLAKPMLANIAAH